MSARTGAPFAGMPFGQRTSTVHLPMKTFAIALLCALLVACAPAPSPSISPSPSTASSPSAPAPQCLVPGPGPACEPPDEHTT